MDHSKHYFVGALTKKNPITSIAKQTHASFWIRGLLKDFIDNFVDNGLVTYNTIRKELMNDLKSTFVILPNLLHAYNVKIFVYGQKKTITTCQKAATLHQSLSSNRMIEQRTKVLTYKCQ